MLASLIPTRDVRQRQTRRFLSPSAWVTNLLASGKEVHGSFCALCVLCGQELLTATDAKVARRTLLLRGSGFFVLVGFVDGNAAEIFRQLQQALVVVIPVGGGLVNHHDALVGEAEL